MSKQINLKDLVTEGRIIQEKFNKRMMNEFSPMSEIHTEINVYLDAHKMIMGYGYVDFAKIISKSNGDALTKKIKEVVEKFGKENGATFDEFNSSGSPVCNIEWDYEMSIGELGSMREKLKNEVEKVFNTYLFEYPTYSYTYRATGVLGTGIKKGKVKNVIHDESFGNGRESYEEYESFIQNLLNTRPALNRREVLDKTNQIMANYFNNPKVLFQKTDWLPYIKSQVKKLFPPNPRIPSKSI